LRIVVPCPAKINTYLAVGAPDSRGYHPLRTVFLAVGLFDTLVVETGNEPGIFCDWPEFPAENTISKTQRLLQEVVSLPPLRITLEKRIPSQAGLGGGSSDAAGLIRAAERLAPGRIPRAELQAIAAAVGADVPFFLVGGRALGEGYGERLTPLPDQSLRSVLIALPNGVRCATAEMYARLDGTQATRNPLETSAGLDVISNDFLPVAPDECKSLVEKLASFGAESGLSGSGSAVFAYFDEDAGVTEALDALVGLADVFVTRTLSRAESLAVEVQA